ncbi:hypothetical protein [Endozoicomonas sp. 4G]|uniref:hypothetical protein n=1 Tax=Endozoicomonas sp. 4G TaxID=2872754 RepID=UPI0020786E44|nr:hypothetical protein [Endozoicomonas sp. 4G]
MEIRYPVEEYKCAACRDTEKCNDSLTLSCGHAFGRKCKREWMEATNQKACLLCAKSFTDNDIAEIKRIPLRERMVTISKKTIRCFCRAISTLAPSVATPVAVGYAVGAAAFGAAFGSTGVVGPAVPIARAWAAFVISVVWAAKGGERVVNVASGIATGVAAGFATSATVGTAGAFGAATVVPIGKAAKVVDNYVARNF